jgi:pimeloyl-ACP methyl ester carboxylesterase
MKPAWFGRALSAFAFFAVFAGSALGQYELVKIEADSAKGFEWPYYLVIPETLKTPTFLIVTTNNTGVTSDDPAVHDRAARDNIWFLRFTAGFIGSPMMTPTFPRPAQISQVYTHALDRATLLTKVSKLQRIDLQLVAMIEDAKARLREKGVAVEEKVWMFGMSASGSFTSRFAVLHPEVLQAASIGSPGWGPIVPVAEWKGRRLPYPEGIADLEELTGKPFNLEAFRQVALEFYVGDLDQNTNPWWDPRNDAEVALVDEVFNGGPELLWRWPQYEAIYNQVGASSRWLIYPGLGHSMNAAWLVSMFEQNRASPPPPPPPKPLYPNFSFLNLQSSAGAEVRVTLVNTAVVSARVEVLGLDSQGETRDKVALEVPAESRREIVAGEAFASPASITSLLVQSDSGFLTGYSQVTLGGQTFVLPGAEGSTSGALMRPGIGRIAAMYFLNVSSSTANARVTAWDETGIELATATFDLRPKARSGGSLGTVFGSDLPAATSFTYTSTATIAGFILGYSGETGTLQALPAIPDYSR